MRKKSAKPKTSGIISQCLGMAIVISGILLELFLRTYIGFVAITAGSVAWATGTWIRRK